MACRLVGAKPLSEPMMDIVYWTLRNKLQWNLNRNSNIFIQENAFKNVVWKMAAILFRFHCVNSCLMATIIHKSSLPLCVCIAIHVRKYLMKSDTNHQSKIATCTKMLVVINIPAITSLLWHSQRTRQGYSGYFREPFEISDDNTMRLILCKYCDWIYFALADKWKISIPLHEY